MASFLDKVKVPTAVSDNTKVDLSHQHISSIDMFQLQPNMYYDMVADSKIDVNFQTLVRLNPLPVPTFGRISLHHRAFFVPYRTIFRGWTDFITDSVHVPSSKGAASGLLQFVPSVSNFTFVELFKKYIYGLGTSTDLDGHGPFYDPSSISTQEYEDIMSSTSLMYRINTNADAADVVMFTGTSGYQGWYCFTALGRQFYKIIESLGYKIVWSDVPVSDDKEFIDHIYSAMPLLALGKIFCDHYFPTQYTSISDYDYVLSLCNHDIDTSQFLLTEDDLSYILWLCSFVYYDTDMFTASFDVPNQPVVGNVSDFKLSNIDEIGRVLGTANHVIDKQNVVTNNSGLPTADNGRYGELNAPFVTGYLNTTANAVVAAGFSQFLVDALKRFTDFMKRNQMSSSRALERYLARYGVAIPAEKLNRSIYVGSEIQDVVIGDIMSTADTNGASLGSYAGKGISSGSGHFEFKASEDGIFMVLTSLVPNVGYFQGVDPSVKRLTKTDFFIPELTDGLGVEAVSSDELYVPQRYNANWKNLFKHVFGFLPRGYSYKIKNDHVTGNMRLFSINGANPNTPSEFNAANSWHLMRTFDDADFPNGADSVVHGPAFLNGRLDRLQYKRIFYDVAASSPDNFIMITNFDMVAYLPMCSLFDTYEFDEHGKEVTLQVHGPKLN